MQRPSKITSAAKGKAREQSTGTQDQENKLRKACEVSSSAQLGLTAPSIDLSAHLRSLYCPDSNPDPASFSAVEAVKPNAKSLRSRISVLAGESGF